MECSFRSGRGLLLHSLAGSASFVGNVLCPRDPSSKSFAHKHQLTRFDASNDITFGSFHVRQRPLGSSCILMPERKFHAISAERL